MMTSAYNKIQKHIMVLCVEDGHYTKGFSQHCLRFGVLWGGVVFFSLQLDE